MMSGVGAAKHVGRWGETPVSVRPGDRMAACFRLATGRRALTFSERGLPSAPAAAGRGVFVGRVDELAVLEAAAAAARRGQPRVVLVEGEAGSGKSTLLARFARGWPTAAVLRASGDEAELLLPYGVVGQLMASARGTGGSPPGLLTAELSDGVDPLAVGAELVGWLGQVCRGRGMVLAVIDDLQWADGPSARAFLFAVRRLQADRVLVVVSARPGELARVGEGWLPFPGGRSSGGPGPPWWPWARGCGGAGPGARGGRAAAPRRRPSAGGDGRQPVVLPGGAGRGRDRTALTGSAGRLGVPRSLAAVVLGRVGALSPAARELVAAAAVLGSPPRAGGGGRAGGPGRSAAGAGGGGGGGDLGRAAGWGRGRDRVQPSAGAAGGVRRSEPGPAASAAPAGGGPGGPGPGAGAPGGGGGRPGRWAGRRAGGGRPGSPRTWAGRRRRRPGWRRRRPPAATPRRPIAACWTRWRSWSPTARWPRRRSLPPAWRRPGRRAAKLVAGHAGFPRRPGRCGRGPPAGGVAGP